MHWCRLLREVWHGQRNRPRLVEAGDTVHSIDRCRRGAACLGSTLWNVPTRAVRSCWETTGVTALARADRMSTRSQTRVAAVTGWTGYDAYRKVPSGRNGVGGRESSRPKLTTPRSASRRDYPLAADALPRSGGGIEVAHVGPPAALSRPPSRRLERQRHQDWGSWALRCTTSRRPVLVHCCSLGGSTSEVGIPGLAG